MDDLTDEEIAKLRFSVGRASFGPSLGSRVPDALPRLLDEVERRRAEDRAIEATLDAPETPEFKALADSMPSDPEEILKRARERLAKREP